jgi:hypothetical protein
MKPFDLEKALSGEPVITREGKEVKQLKYFNTKEANCLYGVMDYEVYYWKINGTVTNKGSHTHDLFMAPKTMKVWANVYYSDKKGLVIGSMYQNEESAKNSKADYGRYIKTIEAEIPA